MQNSDELFKYHPKAETAVIKDSTPRAILSESPRSSGPSYSEAMFDEEIIFSEDLKASTASNGTIEAEIPDGSNLLDGLHQYVGDMYADKVGFDEEDIELGTYKEGESTLKVTLEYRTEPDYVDDITLGSGTLTVSGEVKEKHLGDLENKDYARGGE